MMAKRKQDRMNRGGRFFTAKMRFPSYGMKGALLVGHTASGQPLVAQSDSKSRPCIPTKGRSLKKTDCNTQLIFTPQGPKLRFCHARGKEGAVTSVSSPMEATRMANAFCKCVKSKKNAKACAVEVGGMSMGRYKGKRR
jgi:hypothetical protein